MRCQVASGSVVTRARAGDARRGGARRGWNDERKQNAPGGANIPAAEGPPTLPAGLVGGTPQNARKAAREGLTRGRWLACGLLSTTLWTRCRLRALVYSPDPLPGPSSPP